MNSLGFSLNSIKSILMMKICEVLCAMFHLLHCFHAKLKKNTRFKYLLQLSTGQVLFDTVKMAQFELVICITQIFK